MYKAISLLVLSAALIAVALTACSPQVAEEETTDNSSIISAIDNSSPITKGNLITKTIDDLTASQLLQDSDPATKISFFYYLCSSQNELQWV